MLRMLQGILSQAKERDVNPSPSSTSRTRSTSPKWLANYSKEENYKKEKTIVKELKKQNVFKILEEDNVEKKKEEVTRFEKAEKKGMIPKVCGSQGSQIQLA